MANVRNANTHYVDATGTLTTDNVKVAGFVLTATAANAVAAITDAHASPKNKLNLRLAASGDSKHFDFSHAPIQFPAGVAVPTLTNAILTVIYT